MKFGVFDHLDDSGLPLGEFYENRLRLVEEICMLDHMSGADTAAVLALPEIADILRAQGLEPTGLGPDAFGRLIREDLVRWKTLTQELGIRAEN